MPMLFDLPQGTFLGIYSFPGPTGKWAVGAPQLAAAFVTRPLFNPQTNVAVALVKVEDRGGLHAKGLRLFDLNDPAPDAWALAERNVAELAARTQPPISIEALLPDRRINEKGVSYNFDWRYLDFKPEETENSPAAAFERLAAWHQKIADGYREKGAALSSGVDYNSGKGRPNRTLRIQKKEILDP